MSLETWRKEFCPTEVEELDEASSLEILERDLKKWIGLRPENLEEHEIRLYDTCLSDDYGETFGIHSGTCALCYNFKCVECPLFIVRGGFSCCKESDIDGTDPYEDFCSNDNPEPMIELITKAIEEGRENEDI